VQTSPIGPFDPQPVSAPCHVSRGEKKKPTRPVPGNGPSNIYSIIQRLIVSLSAISAFSKIYYLSNLKMSAHAPTTPHKSRVEQTLNDYLNDYNLEVPNLADSVKPGPNTRKPEAYSLEDIATTVSKGEASTTSPCGNATRKLWTAWWWQNQHPLPLKRVSSLPEHSIFLRFAFCNVL
jgi:hypothetical protein